MKNVHPCKKVSHQKDICVTGIKKTKNVTYKVILEHRGFVFFIPATKNVLHYDCFPLMESKFLDE